MLTLSKNSISSILKKLNQKTRRMCFVKTLLLMIVMTWAQYYPIADLFLDLFLALSLVVLLFILVKNTLTNRKNSQVLMCRTFSCVAVIMWAILLVGEVRNDWLALTLIKLNAQPYASCNTSGVIFDGDKRLAVCSIDNKWWRSGFTKSIIYDSSDQIVLNQDQRSKGWANAVLTLQNVPFGVIGFSARRLLDHFYVVEFTDDLDLPQNGITH